MMFIYFLSDAYDVILKHVLPICYLTHSYINWIRHTRNTKGIDYIRPLASVNDVNVVIPKMEVLRPSSSHCDAILEFSFDTHHKQVSSEHQARIYAPNVLLPSMMLFGV